MAILGTGIDIVENYRLKKILDYRSIAVVGTPLLTHIVFSKAGAINGDSVSVHGTLVINSFILLIMHNFTM